MMTAVGPVKAMTAVGPFKVMTAVGLVNMTVSGTSQHDDYQWDQAKQ